MNRWKQIGPDVQKRYTYLELPIGDTAIGMPSDRVKTGLWRYVRPVFEYKIPPCQDACPLGNSIQKFVLEVSEGNLHEAWSSLAIENPFPGVCGRICHHPCEGLCNRKELDGAVSIQGLERYVADHYYDQPVKLPVLREKTGKKIAVVGSGPAGLACAYFLTLMGHGVTVFEAAKELGGVLQGGVPPYRLPRRVLKREIENILALGVEVRFGCRIGKDIEFSRLLKHDAVFVAAGAGRELMLKAPGEESDGVYRSMDVLSAADREKRLHLGKRVLVIGGGNVAMDVASTAIRMGVEEVSVVCLEQRDQMPAWDYEIEDAVEEGVNIVNGFGVKKILQRNGSMTGIEFKRCTAIFDENGLFSPRYDENDVMTMKSDTAVIAIGRVADLSFLARGGISLNQKGVVAVDPLTLETSIPGVFAGGDIIDQPRNVSAAIGSAKRAAIAIDHYLRGHDIKDLNTKASLGRTMREHLGLDKNSGSKDRAIASIQDLNLNYAEFAPRHTPKKLPLSRRIRNFNEITSGMTSAEAKQEASRCLSCGACRLCGSCYVFCPDGCIRLDLEGGCCEIDYDYCKGCGVCENECPTGAIAMKTEGDM